MNITYIIILIALLLIAIIFLVLYFAIYRNKDSFISNSNDKNNINTLKSLETNREFLSRLTLEQYLKSLNCENITILPVEKLQKFSTNPTFKSNSSDKNILFLTDDPFSSKCVSTKNFNNFLDNPKIVLCIATNWMDVDHPKLIRIPIGFESKMLVPSRPEFTKGKTFSQLHSQYKNINKKLKISCDSHLSSQTSQNPASGYRDDRNDMIVSMNNHKNSSVDKWNKRLSGSEYMKKLSSYEFSLCPEGNGMDTHRFMESYGLGTRPIVRKGWMTPLHIQFPGVIVIDEWDDIFNISNLNDIIDESVNSDMIYLDYWLYKSMRSMCKIVMFFSKSLIDEWLNFLSTARKVGVADLLIVFPLDKESEKAISEQEDIEMDTRFVLHDNENKEGDFGTKNFHNIVKKKLIAISIVLEQGYFTFYLDTDVVLFRDPVADYFSMDPKPIYMQSDIHGFETKSKNIDNHCTGVIFLAPCEYSKQTIRKASKILDNMSHGKNDDQKAMNDAVGNKDKVGTLNPITYPNGARFFKNNKLNKKIKNPVLFHNNWIVGTENKVKRFKKYNMWYI